MRNYLVFDGIDSRDYGIYLSGEGTYNVPEKDYEFIEVPGRNGDVCFWNGRWKNMTIEYPCYMRDLQGNLEGFMSAMMATEGYCALQDSYHEYSRDAVFTGPTQVKPGQANVRGSFTLSFNCKPQKILTETLDGAGILPASEYDRVPFVYMRVYKRATATYVPMSEFDRVIVTIRQLYPGSDGPGSGAPTGQRLEIVFYYIRGISGWAETGNPAEASAIYRLEDATTELLLWRGEISIIESERWRTCFSSLYNSSAGDMLWKLPAGYDYAVEYENFLTGTAEEKEMKRDRYTAYMSIEGRRSYI